MAMRSLPSYSSRTKGKRSAFEANLFRFSFDGLEHAWHLIVLYVHPGMPELRTTTAKYMMLRMRNSGRGSTSHLFLHKELQEAKSSSPMLCSMLLAQNAIPFVSYVTSLLYVKKPAGATWVGKSLSLKEEKSEASEDQEAETADASDDWVRNVQGSVRKKKN
eukprot:1161081-Pelagomonas_calceolata.AAC.2